MFEYDLHKVNSDTQDGRCISISKEALPILSIIRHTEFFFSDMQIKSTEDALGLSDK